MRTNVAMIPLAAGAQLKTEEVFRAMNDTCQVSPIAVSKPNGEKPLVFSFGKSQVANSKMPVPLSVPDDEKSSLVSYMWSDVTNQLSKQAEHLLVAISSDESTIETVQALTRVTVAILNCCPEGLGVYWSPAGHIVPRDMFVSLALEMKTGEPPIPLWVSVRIGAAAPGTSSVYTKGLAQFDLPELEVVNSESTHGELARGLLEVADYLISDRPVVKAGDTFETFWSPSVRVCFAESSFGLPGQVIRLV